MTPIRIILHHSLTQDSQTASWGAIRKWHMGLTGSNDLSSPNFNPYILKPDRDIGYHFGIELVGDHYETLIGRLWNEVGAHCRGQNHDSIGICFVGNFDLAPPPDAQWDMGVHLVAALCRTLAIPIASIFGHHDFDPKTCPGTQFDLAQFRKDTKAAYLNPIP